MTYAILAALIPLGVALGWFLRGVRTTMVTARVAAKNVILDAYKADLDSYNVKLALEHKDTLEIAAKLRGFCDDVERGLTLQEAAATREGLRHIRARIQDMPPPPKGPLQ